MVLTTDPTPFRAAQYACHRNITIVRTYADEGKSGLSIGGRVGL